MLFQHSLVNKDLTSILQWFGYYQLTPYDVFYGIFGISENALNYSKSLSGSKYLHWIRKYRNSTIRSTNVMSVLSSTRPTLTEINSQKFLGSSIYTASFLPQLSYLQLQGQKKISPTTFCSRDISMSWGCPELQGNTWAASLSFLPTQLLCLLNVSDKKPNNVCTMFMLQLIKHPHYTNWQALDYCCYPTYFFSTLGFLAAVWEEHETLTVRATYCSCSNIHSCETLASNTERASASYKSIHETQKLKQM